MQKQLLVLLSVLLITLCFGQNEVVWLHPNAGQWDAEILYQIDVADGTMMVDSKGFTINLIEMGHEHDGEEHQEEEIKQQVVKAHFLGSSWQGNKKEFKNSTFYRNYFLGNDASKWKSKVHSVEEVKMLDLYPGVDLELSGSKGLKYSLVLDPHVDLNQIVYSIEGANSIRIDDDGNLRYTTYFGEFIESKPIAWTLKNGRKKQVEINYELIDNNIHFIAVNSYNTTDTLVIDPNITFSTFTGSTANNWGTTATPDYEGNTFGGGTIFNTGGVYPTTPGAFSISHNGGIDVGITKFNVDGSSLIYSTYLGGLDSDAPNSMICNENGDLFIFGVTGSSNFPILTNSYDVTFGGGPSLAGNTSNSLGFSTGSDIFVVRMSADGTSLLGSTYVGGTGADGFNRNGLKINYGDQFRGEIVLDSEGKVYVASTTESWDFPRVGSGAGVLLSGTQDAVIFKMEDDLSTMLWSRYYGGTNLDNANALQVGDNGTVYVVGGTNSSNLSFNGEDVTFGGAIDGYIATFNASNGAQLGGTYMGQAEVDQNYFVQLDIDGFVYTYGLTQSFWTPTPGTYSVENSSQIFRKYSPDLSTVEWTTTIGAGTGNLELSPTAFLVSDCYDIYFSGWGGALNANVNSSSSYTFGSTTSGFPVTPDAYQSTTNGNNFYIGVLSPDAEYLKYATFMGGTTGPANHVDGGTSRFDKQGRIYHAVCASCGMNLFNGFPTTPGAWSNTAPSTGYACNMAVFKFDLNTVEAILSDIEPLICIPNPVEFYSYSENGNEYFWDFGDGNTSTEQSPQHYYTSVGLYDATLIVNDTNNCYSTDTVHFQVNIGEFTGGVVMPTEPVCPYEAYQLEAYGGAQYAWEPAAFLDDSTLSMPTATVSETTTFTVYISDSCGVDVHTVTLPVYDNLPQITPDTSVCIGSSVQLDASPGSSFTWYPSATLNDYTIANPVATPTSATTYVVDIVSVDGCEMTESVHVEVYYNPPVPVAPDELVGCENSEATIEVSGAAYYYWDPATIVSPTTGPVVTISFIESGYVYTNYVNSCGTVTDSIFVDIENNFIQAYSDTIICPGQSVSLMATGGIAYSWSPPLYLSNPNVSSPVSTPQNPIIYTVTGMDSLGCIDTADVYIDLYPPAYITTSSDVYAFYGDEVELSATTSTSGPIIWTPTEYLTCAVCETTIANPDQDYFYIASYTDENGCYDSDSVFIHYQPLIFIPNTFTPNNDELNANNVFKAEGGNINTFEMLIFNRWGELVYTLNDINESWDGTYKGQPCQDGTYTWKVKYTDMFDKEYKLAGHVNVLR